MSEKTGQSTDALPRPLPIFALGTVLFPGAWLPLRVFEARYVDMTRDCLRKNQPFGVCLISEGREVGKPAKPHMTGCLAHIDDCDMQQMGVLQLRTRGTRRFRVNSLSSNSQGLVLAEAELLPEEPSLKLPAQYRNCRQLVELTMERHGPEIFPEPHAFDDAVWVSYRLAQTLPLPMEARQQLLEMDDSLQRLAVLQRLLTGTNETK
ncbi:MAG TPA: LON peptidase substrate-binding domain-containing protein [Burkholderiales bacterium]|nr:LON peptidase substrate-binding domain-containing protein [Burkholderiales bacterium]